MNEQRSRSGLVCVPPRSGPPGGAMVNHLLLSHNRDYLSVHYVML